MYKMQQTNIKYCAVSLPSTLRRLLTVSHYREITSVERQKLH